MSFHKKETEKNLVSGQTYPLRRVRNIVHQVVENLFGTLHASRLEGVITVPGQEVGAVKSHRACSLTQFDGILQSWISVKSFHTKSMFASIGSKVSLI